MGHGQVSGEGFQWSVSFDCDSGYTRSRQAQGRALDTGVEEHREKAPRTVNYSIITVSDTRQESDDFSGDAIRDLMSVTGHKAVRRSIVKDDSAAIQKALRESIEDERVQAIIVTGGTGISKRDVTIESVEHFREKELPGFGEIFRLLSFDEIGSAAMMSRSTAFISEGKVVFCLPGSEKAVRLAVSRLISPEIGHMVWEANR